jgi:hypothetical protein
MDKYAHLLHKHLFSFPLSLPPSTLLNLKAGDCAELTALSVLAMRSLGIPAAWDFTPQWANRSMGHDWATVLGHPAPVPFSFGDAVPFGKHLEGKPNDKPAKVFRRTYSVQKQSLAMQQVDEDIPPFFKNPHFQDVSSLYFDAVDATVGLTIPPPYGQRIAYISVFNNADWIPIHWAHVKRDRATFTQMAKNCAYLAVYYDEERLYPASHPFIIENQNNIKMLIPDTNNTITARIKRKYPCKWYDMVKERITGGVFEGANNEDFSDAVTLYTITDFPDVKMPVSIALDHSAEYQYVRYVSADSGFVYMAEIEFYNEMGEKLSGNVIGTEGSSNNSRFDRRSVFDGDPLSWFEAPVASGGWVGLDLGSKEIVSKIKYLPRNSDNHINTGEQYELFYFDGEWISLGQQMGNNSHVLVYDNVPDNALLLLKNHTKGREERIFIYENEKQVFY